MAGNKTLTIIKPYAVNDGYIGSILSRINDAGFRITAMRFTHLNIKDAQAFYAIHKDKNFFDRLTAFMSSGPIVVAILEKDNAVADYRKLIGATNPEEAEEGTLRKLFGRNMEANAVHGSDSDENADIESNFFFSKMERF